VDFERKMMERMENMVREVEEEDKRRRAQGEDAGSAPAAEADDDDYHSRHRYQDGEAPRPTMRPVFVDRTDPEEVRRAVETL